MRVSVAVGIAAATLIVGIVIGAFFSSMRAREFMTFNKISELEKQMQGMSMHIDNVSRNMEERANQMREHIGQGVQEARQNLQQKFQEIDSRLERLAMMIRMQNFQRRQDGMDFGPQVIARRMPPGRGDDFKFLMKGNPDGFWHNRTDRMGPPMLPCDRGCDRDGDRGNGDKDDDLNWLFRNNGK